MSGRLLFGLFAAALLLALPHLATSAEQRELVVFLVINALLVCSYRLLTLTGEWSLAHVVMMGVGAYASALFAKAVGLPVPLSILLGAATAGLVAYILSFPLLRMSGFYFLIGSFAAGEIIRLTWRLSDLRPLFGGPKGIRSIPPWEPWEIFGTKIAWWDATNYYYLALAIVSVSLFLLWRIEKSRHGLIFHALHWQDKLAESVGVNARGYRTTALIAASVFAGLSGGLLAHYLGTISPNAFEVSRMVDVLVWVIVGGTATFYGPLLGLFVLTVVNELVLRSLGIDQARPLFLGAILILAVLFLPKGLESLVEAARERIFGRSSTTAEPKAGATR
ncbi:MAG: branched-chain amino acid ABC transporter permease [Rhodospirillales bacterium]